MSQTQVILNPYAAGGRAARLWDEIEPLMRERFGDLLLAITQTPAEVLNHLRNAYERGSSRIIGVGGDGTNHAMINALATLELQEYPTTSIPYGTLPIGTGRDWARSRGIPMDFRKSIDWLADAEAHATDIGKLLIDEKSEQYFLNIASTGLGGAVDERVNRIEHRRPWTFLKATVQSILTYEPQRVSVSVDGEQWFDDRALLVVVANGTTFGHGMKIAPNAVVDDGYFDVIVLEAVSKLRVLTQLGHVYRGTHLQQDGVHSRRAKKVEIAGYDTRMAIDLDGEYATGNQLTFENCPGLLKLLT